MKVHPKLDFFYQLMALILAIAIVHGIYVVIIRPNAEFDRQKQEQLSATNPQYEKSRSVYIILKDYEQEIAFIFMFWALSIIGLKTYHIRQERLLLDSNLIPTREGLNVLPEDARLFIRPIQALPEHQQKYFPAIALSVTLRRFSATGNIQNTSDSLEAICDREANRLDSELAIVRYIAWAIPSLGFIGTVRGIGAALGEAYKVALNGDISGVTANLGVAFNSTFIALLLGLVLMFLLHQVQLFQERLVLDTQDYADQNLIQNMRVMQSDST